MDTIQNAVIIGGGPAGLSAAVYMARATLQPLVFAGSPPGGQLMLTTEVENFPGFHGIMGPDLVQKMREQAKEFGTQILDENVTSVDFSKEPFTVSYSDKTVQAKTVIIATGAQALWLGLDSEQRLRGRGVSACATCDGFFFRNKDVAVVGGGDTAMEEAQTLTNFANKVYLIHRKDSFRASKIMQERVLSNPKIIPVLNNEIIEVVGEQKVEGLKLKNTYNNAEILTVNGLFLAIGHKPDTQLFADKIELDEKGYIINTAMYAMRKLKGEKVERPYDPEYQTQTIIPGVFAAGDCVDHVYRQAGTAAGMGIAASLDAERWLMNK